jgi:hypothetical protein
MSYSCMSPSKKPPIEEELPVVLDAAAKCALFFGKVYC